MKKIILFIILLIFLIFGITLGIELKRGEKTELNLTHLEEYVNRYLVSQIERLYMIRVPMFYGNTK